MIELLDTIVALALCFGAVWLAMYPRRAVKEALRAIRWLPSPLRTGIHVLVGMYVLKRLQRRR
jgi:hypothetical protein